MSDVSEAASRDDGRVDVAPASHARLVEIAELCHYCRASFHETAYRFHWQPADPSAGLSLAIAIPSPDPVVASSVFPESGHRLVTHAVQTYLATAAGHLGALGALLAHDEVMYAPGMLIRSALESVARVFWILGDNTDSPEQLLARAYLEELLSAEEAKKAAGRMGGKGSVSHARYEKGWADLRAEIMGRFAGVTKADLGKRLLSGEQLLGPQAAVKAMYDFFSKNGASSIGGPVAEGVYDYLSNVTHPTLYPSRQITSWVSDPAHPGEVFAQLNLSIEQVEREVSVAVLAYYQALSYVTSFYGWDRSVFADLDAEVARVLPAAFV